MRRRLALRWNLPWLTSKDMRHYVRTVLNHSGMPSVERRYWQGHAPDLSNMDERYGDMSMDDILTSQRRYLPSGVVGTFLILERGADETPKQLDVIHMRLRAKEIEASDAVDAIKELIRQQERAVLVR